MHSACSSAASGGAGYLLKDRVLDVTEFAAAVRRVGEGGSVVDSALVAQLRCPAPQRMAALANLRNASARCSR